MDKLRQNLRLPFVYVVRQPGPIVGMESGRRNGACPRSLMSLSATLRASHFGRRISYPLCWNYRGLSERRKKSCVKARRVVWWKLNKANLSVTSIPADCSDLHSQYFARSDSSHFPRPVTVLKQLQVESLGAIRRYPALLLWLEAHRSYRAASQA